MFDATFSLQFSTTSFRTLSLFLLINSSTLTFSRDVKSCHRLGYAQARKEKLINSEINKICSNFTLCFLGVLKTISSIQIAKQDVLSYLKHSRFVNNLLLSQFIDFPNLQKQATLESNKVHHFIPSAGWCESSRTVRRMSSTYSMSWQFLRGIKTRCWMEVARILDEILAPSSMSAFWSDVSD